MMFSTRLLSMYALTLVVLCTASVTAISQVDPISTDARPLGTLLHHDGTFNTSAGYEGTIDAHGWRIETDITGRPRFVRDVFSQLFEPASVAAQVPGDENWADLFGAGELDGDINAMVSSNGMLYVGGSFKLSAGTVLNGVGRWDGNNWSAMGSGPVVGVDGAVYALAVSGNDVYVGGRFSKAGGVAVANVARWNATSNTWSAMGTGVVGPGGGYAYIGTIVVNGTSVFVGGNFATAGGVVANNVAEWTTSGAWSSLGTGAANGVNGDVLALSMLGTTLYAGGSFPQAGGITANNLAAWNTTARSWSALVDADGANGLNGYINAIASGQGVIYIGGKFQKVVPSPFDKPGGDSVSNIIRWNGTRWLVMSNTFDQDPSTGGDGRFVNGYVGTDNVVRGITVVGDSVYVSGTFRTTFPGSLTSGTMATAYIARCEGNGIYGNLAWARMRTGTGGYVNAMAVVGTSLYVGGSFRTVGGSRQSRIARWNIANGVWSGLKTGPNGQLYAVATNGTDIYTVGAMATPDGASGYYIARWTGKDWETVNTSVGGPLPAAVTIYAMAISGNNIYVGGVFTTANNISAVNVARYNTSTKIWSPLGTPGAGVGGGDVPFVTALAVRGNDVYVGGRFSIADDIAANNIARWNGSTWSALGSGIDGFVFAIGLAPNGDVYAGGSFNSAGGVPAKMIARWDGTKWNALGAGVNDLVNAITVEGSNVYVGGDFGMAGTVASRAIARWDGTQWNGMDGGVSGTIFPTVNAISVSGSSVYASGSFSHAGTTPAANIARWDGTKWNTLGSGTNDQIRGSVIKGSDLYVAGDFNIAGSKASFKFGQWMVVPGIIIPDGDGSDGIMSSFSGAGQAVTGMAEIEFSTQPIEEHPAIIQVYDHLGRLVATLDNGRTVSGTYRFTWDTRDVPPGVFYCRMENAGRVETKAVMVRR